MTFIACGIRVVIGYPLREFSATFTLEAFGGSEQDQPGERDMRKVVLLREFDRDTSLRESRTQAPEDAPPARAVDHQPVHSTFSLLAEEQLEIECSAVGTRASGLPRALAFPFPNVG